MGPQRPDCQHNRPDLAVSTRYPKGLVNDNGPRGWRRVAHAGG